MNSATSREATTIDRDREGGSDRVTGPASYFPSIEKKYGKPISHWLDLICSASLTSHKALVDWLKADFGIGHGHATALVGYALVQRASSAGRPAGPQQERTDRG
jgi:hypothetical protein